MPARPQSVIMPVGARWPQELPVAFHAKGPAVSLFYLSVLLCVPTAAEPAPPDSVMFGKDRLIFQKEYALPTAAEQKAIAKDWDESGTAQFGPTRRLGAPFRDGAEIGESRPAVPHWSSRAVRSHGFCARPTWDSLGFFLDKVESPEHCENFLAILVDREGWMDAAQAQNALRAAEKNPFRLYLKVVHRDLDERVVGKRPFRENGAWLFGCVTVADCSLVEYKFAINRKNRVAFASRVLVEGPPPGIVSVAELKARGMRPEDFGLPSGSFDQPHHDVYFEADVFLKYSAFGSQWLRQLSAAEPAIRNHATAMLGNASQFAGEAVPDLCKALANRDAGVRDAAVHVLGRIGRPALPGLRKALSDANANVRRAAAAAIEVIEEIDARTGKQRRG